MVSGFGFADLNDLLDHLDLDDALDDGGHLLLDLHQPLHLHLRAPASLPDAWVRCYNNPGTDTWLFCYDNPGTDTWVRYYDNPATDRIIARAILNEQLAPPPDAGVRLHESEHTRLELPWSERAGKPFRGAVCLCVCVCARARVCRSACLVLGCDDGMLCTSLSWYTMRSTGTGTSWNTICPHTSNSVLTLSVDAGRPFSQQHGVD
eukprot:3528225-Rhodomonas_salina.4